MTFKELNIAEPILRAIREKGYTEPTPIQEQGIPVGIEGKDILGIAQTGTGKTAAFAIPILNNLYEERLRSRKSQQETESVENVEDAQDAQTPRKDRRGRRHGRQGDSRMLKALILTPTRELAVQISDCFTDYGKYTGLRHTAVYGGVKQGPQTEKLRRGVDILIATPGRLLDLIGQGEIKLNEITHLVLDEADRMLDMGFIADIRRLLQMLPRKRQTQFFSATMPSSISSLAREMLNKPVRIEVTPESSTVDTVDQCIYFVEKQEKRELLISLLRKDEDKSVLIFSRTKHGADNISRSLRKAGIRNEAIHGDKSQGQRQRALSDFKEGRVKVMVATDIAARGIDIKDLQLVINYDLPDVVETYVHRIGRTGRAGQCGTALTFCTQEEHMIARDIQKLVGRKIDSILYQAQ